MTGASAFLGMQIQQLAAHYNPPRLIRCCFKQVVTFIENISKYNIKSITKLLFDLLICRLYHFVYNSEVMNWFSEYISNNLRDI